jgi:hypothetical protein
LQATKDLSGHWSLPPEEFVSQNWHGTAARAPFRAVPRRWTVVGRATWSHGQRRANLSAGEVGEKFSVDLFIVT